MCLESIYNLMIGKHELHMCDYFLKQVVMLSGRCFSLEVVSKKPKDVFCAPDRGLCSEYSFVFSFLYPSTQFLLNKYCRLCAKQIVKNGKITLALVEFKV